MWTFNPLTAGICNVFGYERVALHRGAWVATLIGTLLGVQDYKKVKFPGRDNLSLAVKGLLKGQFFFKYRVIAGSLPVFCVSIYFHFSLMFSWMGYRNLSL